MRGPDVTAHDYAARNRTPQLRSARPSKEIAVHREEIYERIKREAQQHGGGQIVRGQFGSGTDGKADFT